MSAEPELHPSVTLYGALSVPEAAAWWQNQALTLAKTLNAAKGRRRAGLFQGEPEPAPDASWVTMDDGKGGNKDPFADLPAPQWDVEYRAEPKVYVEPRDWWIGYYRSDTHHYVCPLPCVVIRWNRRAS